MNKEVDMLEAGFSRDMFVQQALPGVASVLDITNIKGHAAALEWIKTLFDASVESYPRYIEPSFEKNKQLQSFFFQSKNDLKTTGQLSFSLGYPFLAMNTGGKNYAFPLFLWNVKMVPEKGLRRWQLQLSPSSREVNPFAVYFLKATTGLNLLDLFCFQELKFAKEIGDYTRFFNQLIIDFDLATDSEKISIAPCPDWPLDIPRDQLQLFWCGVLGNFKSRALPALDRGAYEVGESKGEFPPFGRGFLPPALDGVNNTILRNRTTVVEMDHPTNSDVVVDYLLSNTLAQNQRGLVVSNKLPFLKRIEKDLAKAGIEEQVFVLTHPQNDLAVLLNRTRAILKKGDKPIKKDKEYTYYEDKLWRLHKKMYRQHKALKKPIFGHFNRAEVGAFYLYETQGQNPSILDTHLTSDGFEFEPIELEGMINAIGRARELYDDSVSFNHPLNNLHIDIFKQYQEEEALQFIQQRLVEFVGRGRSIQKQYVEHRNTYSKRLTAHYGELYREMYSLKENVQEKIKDFSSRFPSSWKTASNFSLAIRGVLSKEAKKAKEQLDQIRSAYRLLEEKFKENGLFEFDFVTAVTLPKLAENTIAFEKELELWRHRLSNRIQEELLRLSHKTVIKELDVEGNTATLEEELMQYAEDLNNSHLYQLPQQGKMLTLKLRERFLEQMLEQMEDTRFHLKDFSAFFRWQKFWFSLPDKYRQAIKAIIKANPSNWEQTFKSWYFYHCFRLSYDPVLPEVEFEVDEYYSLWTAVQQRLDWAIEKNSIENQKAAIANLHKGDKQTHQYLTDTRSKPQLGELLDQGSVMEFYPLVLATPYMAQQLSKELYFDTVIVDNTLNDIDANDYKKRGERNVILSTKGYRPQLSNQQDTNVTYARLPINLQQRSTFAERTTLIQLNGRYEAETHSNPEEAQHILRLLNKIQPSQHNIYPKVGIICMTKEQRNLLMSYLWDIQENRSAGFEKIQQLERNGMSVFTLEEAVQHQFDIAIWSITFGRTGVHEDLTKSIEYWNDDYSTQCIKILLNQSVQERYILNSISERDLKHLVAKLASRKGAAILMSMLLASMKTTTNVFDEGEVETGSWPTIAMCILPYIQQVLPEEEVHIKQDSLEVLHINDHAVYLFANGCFSSGISTNFVWEYQQKQRLLNDGVMIYSFLPADWVSNPKEEAIKLVEYVLKQEV